MRRIEFRKEASEYVAWIMVWGVVSLLGVRLYLSLMDWPIVGGKVWHIAHILWGGLGMLIGGLVNFLFYGKRAKKISATITGLGLGLFMDEAGKFLSRDNDYFFQPAVMVMYVLFVILFLIYKYAERHQIKSEATLLHSILEDFEDIIREDLTKKEKEKIIERIEKLSKSENKIYLKVYDGLKSIVENVDVKESKKNNKLALNYGNSKGWLIRKVLNKRYFKATLLLFAGIYVIRWIYDAGVVMLTDQKLFDVFLGDYNYFLSVDGWFLGAKVVFDGITAILLGLGIQAMLFGKRKRALLMFEYGILVNIFLSSVFRFYFEQFAGLVDLVIDILILKYVQEMKKIG